MATAVIEPAMVPVIPTINKVFDNISLDTEGKALMGVSVMVQHFTDRLWICVNESASDEDKMRPGTVIIGSPSPMGSAHSIDPMADSVMPSPDELEVVLGDRDCPFTNVLSSHIYHMVAQIAPGKGLCLCLSTRKLMRSLSASEARKSAISQVMRLVLMALAA